MNKLEASKKAYEMITPPMSYQLMVERSVNGEFSKHKKGAHFTWIKRSMATIAAVFAVCVILLNTIPTFAAAAYEIPLVGDIARILTFREYELATSAYDIQVEVPAIRNTGDTELEKSINNQIQDKIDQIVESAKVRGQEMIDGQVAEGVKEDDLIPFHILITYEVKAYNENILSFVINDTESSITAYTYQTFYNIDLNTNQEIKLPSILGDNYSDLIVSNIRKQIDARIEEHPEWSYTITDEELRGMIDELKFYINDAGNVVISFNDGEIAPPPMGTQDFEIIK